MKDFFYRLFIRNWPRKLVALITAIVVWLLVNQTLTVSRTLVELPVHVVNLPPDKTVVGLLSNGLLNKRITVTLTGDKSTVEDLRSTELEVLINAAGHDESWIATIDKRSLVSLNPELELRKHITEVTANDLLIKVSPLITEEVPLTIHKPIGNPPKGYQFLEIWPKHLYQKVSGPEEQVKGLKEKGLELTFSLNWISQAELEALYEKQGRRDMIIFSVPAEWKKVAIPFKENTLEPLNGPRAEFLRIHFLKQKLIPLNLEIPITIFFPVSYSKTINPQAYSLATNDIVQRKEGLKRLTLPVYIKDVSRLFLDVVRDNMLLIIVAAPEDLQGNLHWTIEFVDEKALENAFVEASLKEQEEQLGIKEKLPSSTEEEIRDRFRAYLRKITLLNAEGQPLELVARRTENTIILEQV
ncbi:MAG: hypothetical protein K940chlam9_00567 [Chlamydiae bacterium]|nr:hypothetical protein [Chlamydiota bacterium]